LVTQEIASTFNPMWRAAITSATVDMIDLGGRFVAGAQQRGVDSFVQQDSEFGGLFAGDLAIGARVGVRHVGEAKAEAVVVGAGQRIRSLQIDVVFDQDQRALRVAEVDASGGVGEDHGVDSHAGEHADGKGDLLRGVSLVLVDATLHGGDWHIACLADDKPAGVSDGGGLGKGWNLGVGNFRRVSQGVGEGPEAGAQNESDFRAEHSALQNGLCSGVGKRELVGHS
jgi:hypothetical protein